MKRGQNEKVKKAFELYNQGWKLVNIANKLGISDGTVRSWKKRYNWDGNVAGKRCNVAKNGTHRGKHNKNAEKHGFFSKYLPLETLEIIENIQDKLPLDILWENIQIQYSAIIRSQHIMYVNDINDKTTEVIAESDGQCNKKSYEIQQAWEKQANFLQAQSRAMKTLESMIKKYDELLHKNYELATEEQKARIELLKSKIEKDVDDKIQISFDKIEE